MANQFQIDSDEEGTSGTEFEELDLGVLPTELDMEEEEEPEEKTQKEEESILMTYYEGKFVSVRLPDRSDQFHVAKFEHKPLDKMLNNIYPVSKLMVDTGRRQELYIHGYCKKEPFRTGKRVE